MSESIENLTDQVNQILDHSKDKKRQARNKAEEALKSIRALEARRVDMPVKVSKIDVLPVGATPTIVANGNTIKLRGLPLNQFLYTGKVPLRRQEFEAFRGHVVIDKRGQKAMTIAKEENGLLILDKNNEQMFEPVDMAQNYLNYVVTSRPRLERVFRLDPMDTPNNYWADGFVGKNYPLNWSDAKAIDGILSAGRELDTDMKFGFPHISSSGTIKFNVTFPTWSHDLAPEFGDIINGGVYYWNNPNGHGSTKFGGALEREVCTNGMRGSAPMWDIIHFNQTQYYQRHWEIINIMLGRTDWFKERGDISDLDEMIKEGIPLAGEYEKTFYELFGKSAIESARKETNDMYNLMVSAREQKIESLDAEIEKQAVKFGLKGKVAVLTQLAKDDPTVFARENPTLLDVSNIFSRYANSPDLFADDVMKYQSLSNEILLAAPLTVKN